MSTQLVNHIYRLKRGTEEAIFEANPILGPGEPVAVFCDNGVTRLKIGDGKRTYTDLPFINQENDESLRLLLQEVSSLRKEIDNAGDSVYILTRAAVNAVDDKSLSDRISKAILRRNPLDIISEGNVAIISGPSDIAGAPDEVVSYVYTGVYWEPITSTPSINDIVFDEDLIYTEPIGSLATPSNGHGVINATGKTIKDVLYSILVNRRSPKTLSPSITLTSTNIGAYEVGTKIRVDYTVGTDNGSYEFDDATGVKFNSCNTTFNGTSIRAFSGTFAETTVSDDTNLVLKCSASYTDGICPRDNLGDADATAQIKAGTLTATHSTRLTGYRGWFWGYKGSSNALNINSLTSDQIRSLGSGALKKLPSTITVNKMKQIFFAVPKGSVKGVKVSNSVNGAPQTVNGPLTVEVTGDNNYQPIEYDVFYVDNDNATTSTDTYKVTVL